MDALPDLHREKASANLTATAGNQGANLAFSGKDTSKPYTGQHDGQTGKNASKSGILGRFGEEENGAGHGVRTRDIQLGKLAAEFGNDNDRNDLQERESVVDTTIDTRDLENAPPDPAVQALVTLAEATLSTAQRRALVRLLSEELGAE